MFFACCYISACFQGKIWLIHDSCPFFHLKPLFRPSRRTLRRTAMPVIFVTVHSVTSNYFPAAQSPPTTFILLKKQEIFQIGFRLIYRSIPTFYFKSARHSYKVLAKKCLTPVYFLLFTSLSTLTDES